MLPIVNSFKVFEFDPFLSELHCPVSLTVNCLNFCEQVSSFNSADNHGNQMLNIIADMYGWSRNGQMS